MWQFNKIKISFIWKELGMYPTKMHKLFYKMKNILITGGSGFLGRELLNHKLATKFFDYGNSVTVLARNEGKLIELKNEFPSIEIICGDISDPCIVKKACKGKDTLFHLAAFKHVGLAETQPYQCFMSNIVGTSNLLSEFRGELFVAISTDKAAHLQGVYGASKYIMEKLILEQAKVITYCKFVVPRYGNVIGSTGSIVPKWVLAASTGQEITITDPKATRFFFTVSDAVDLIFEAIDKAESGKPYIKHMRSCEIGTLANAIQKKYGLFKKINYIGLQPGENLHEWLDDNYCSKEAKKFTIDQLIKMI